MPSLKRFEKLVVDANVILSALLGGKALKVFFESEIAEFAVPSPVIREVEGYLPDIAAKIHEEEHALEATLAALPLTEWEEDSYYDKVPEARRRIGRRDPKDVDILALALALGAPVWTNDNDFEESGVDWYPTAKLLSLLFER